MHCSNKHLTRRLSKLGIEINTVLCNVINTVIGTGMVCVSALVVIGCHPNSDGNSDDNHHQRISQSTPASNTPNTVNTNALLKPPVFIKRISGSALLDSMKKSDAMAAQGIPTAICDIMVYKLSYPTVGAAGEVTNASAALMVPTAIASPNQNSQNSQNKQSCQGNRPIVLHAHGTAVEKNYDFTQVASKKNDAGNAAALVAANFAAQGYVVVAPNYAGYDESSLGYHPYLNAKQQSHEMKHALDAARAALTMPNILETTRTVTQSTQPQSTQLQSTSANISDSGQLFLTGYSQGGHVALATARYFESINEPVTAVAPMSAPYAMAAFGDSIFGGQVAIGATVFSSMLFLNYQKQYGNFYTSIEQVINPLYTSNFSNSANTAAFIPSNLSWNQLRLSGKIPQSALFQKAPTGLASLDGISPALPLFSFGFDSRKYLVNNNYRASYLADAEANPDGAIAKTNLLPANMPQHPFRKALKANDLRGYTPSVPTFLCGGNRDPMVFFDVNTSVMQQLWQNNAASSLDVVVMDVDTSNKADRKTDSIQLLGQAKQTRQNFVQTARDVQKQFTLHALTTLINAGKPASDAVLAKGGTKEAAQKALLDAGKLQVVLDYHVDLVSPACTKATREYFAQFQAN